MLISAPGASDRGCSALLGNLGQSLLVELRGPQALLPSLSAGPQGICRPPPRWVPLSCPIGGCWLVPGPAVQGPWGCGHLCVGPPSNAPGRVLTAGFTLSVTPFTTLLLKLWGKLCQGWGTLRSSSLHS